MGGLRERVTVFGADHAVAVIEHGRGAAVDLFESTDVGADVDILGPIAAEVVAPHTTEVVDQGQVGHDAAQGCLPEVLVHVDQPRDHDHPLRVDHLAALGRLQIWAHLDDPGAVDQDRASLQLTDLWVHRDDPTVTDHNSGIHGFSPRSACGNGCSPHDDVDTLVLLSWLAPLR